MIGLCHALLAQPTAQPEPLLIALNQPFAASGETLYFQVLNAVPALPFQSKVGYADLVDAQGQVAVSTLFKLDGLGGNGHLPIPPGIPEKVYFVRIYTKWNLSFGEQAIPYIPLPVYNAFDGELGEFVAITTQRQAIDGDGGRVLPDRDLLGEKESGGGRFEWNTVQPGLACATVVHEALANDWPGQSLAEQVGRWSRPFALAGQLASPENNLQLTFWNGSGGGGLTSPLLKLYQPQAGVFHDADCIKGTVQSEFTLFEGKQTMQLLSFHPGLPRFPEPSKQLPPFVPLPQGLPTNAPERTAAVRSYLQTVRLQRQLDELYQLLPKAAPTTAAPLAHPPADRVFLMKEYQLISSFQDFLTKVLSQTVLQKHADGSVKIILNHPEDREKMPEEPWVMVNGLFVGNLSECLSLPISQIEQVDYYYKRATILREFVFPMTRGLVLGIWLKPGVSEPDGLRSNSFTHQVSGLDLLAPANKADYADAPHVPDFRQAVAWLPNLRPQANGQPVAYTVGSLRGNFCIRTRGLSANGEILENIAHFKVVGK